MLAYLLLEDHRAKKILIIRTFGNIWELHVGIREQRPHSIKQCKDTMQVKYLHVFELVT